MFQQLAREDIDILYSFKRILTNVYFDPGLSGNLFESLYRYLKSRRSIKITYFYFNDEYKYIDMKFENSTYQDCHSQIVKGMINAFKEIKILTNSVVHKVVWNKFKLTKETFSKDELKSSI